MPTVSPRAVALSLSLHGVLLGAASREPTTLTRPDRVGVAAPLDGVISVDLAGRNGTLPPEAAPAGPEQPPTRQSLAQQRHPAPPAALGARPRPTAPASPLLLRQPSHLPPPLASSSAAPSLAPSARGTLSPHPDDPVEALVRMPAAPATGPSAHASGSLASSGAKSPLVAPVAPGNGVAAVGVGPSAPGTAERAMGDAHARLLASYLEAVRERVSRHREYPYLARRANLEGTVCLRVVVAASGRVVGVTSTCGTHQPLVDAALASVSSAAPFPPLPVALGQRLTIDLPVVFALERR